MTLMRSPHSFWEIINYLFRCTEDIIYLFNNRIFIFVLNVDRLTRADENTTFGKGWLMGVLLCGSQLFL